ncbi:MAG: hypothetical protein IJZ49_00335 [Alistipes sp.]|nr:hypothetical protein [Alistipes sp.]
MAEGLKVLMMGGQRVGKSSALAAIIDAFTNAPINTLLTAKDVTQNASEPIASKLIDIRSSLEKNYQKVILVDSGKTEIFNHYTLQLSVSGNNNKMEILFTDMNGEFYQGGNTYQDQVCDMISRYDVFIVAIDTPMLMEAVNTSNPYVNEIINEKFNFVEDIHTFLTSINEKDNVSAKLVIFTPIKCEKWAKENKLDLVVARTKQVYETAIAGIQAHRNIRIEFLPIQTIGSMVFHAHLPASLFTYKKKRLLFFKQTVKDKGSIIAGDKIRLADGDIKLLSEGYVDDDPSAVLILGTDIVRPNSWYYVCNQEYRPHNCEQLALHILEFMLQKMIDAKIREENNRGFLSRGARALANFALNVVTFSLWSNIKDYFGDIPMSVMESIINSMKEQNIIKYTDEGIEVYKDVEFLTR